MKKIGVFFLMLAIVIVGIYYFFFYKTLPNVGTINVPQQLKFSVYADKLKKPRVIAFDPRGRVVVSETESGKILALLDQDGNGIAEDKKELITNLKQPHGLAFHVNLDKKLYLYVAETHMVSRYLYDPETMNLGQRQEILPLPDGGRHFTRTIAFGPLLRSQDLVTNSDVGKAKGDRLYISIGSSCDVCRETTFKRAAILESDEDGTYLAEYARGLRNSVFFDFHPTTKKIWATEMGRDNLGDNLPPDEVNVVEFNKNYGWPVCYGNKITDTVYSPIPTPSDRAMARINPCDDTVAPKIELPAHVAPLGIAFIPVGNAKGQNLWPQEMQGSLLVALHGSWNSSKKVGYKVVRFVFDSKGNVVRSEDFFTGFLSGQDVSGRPVDIKVLSNGTLFISDDYAGLIYRVSVQ